MSLTPAEQRDLDTIGAALLRTDPGLSRRLGADVRDLPCPRRESDRVQVPPRRLRTSVAGVVAVWLVLGLLPLLLGVALSVPVLTGLGVGVTIFGLPLALAPWGLRSR